MGGKNDGRIPAVVVQDGAQDVVPGGRVYAANGLIQQVELCGAAHGKDQLHLFLAALGEGLEPRLRFQFQPGQHFVCLSGVKIGIKFVEHFHQLLHTHPVRQPVGVRQIGHDGFGVRPGGHAGDPDAACTGLQQTVRQLDEGGLAAAVGAKQPHDVAKADVQVYIFQCGLILLVALGQCFTAQKFIH